MKTLRIKQMLVAIFCATISSWTIACDSWVDPNLNIDPNNPQDVSINLILPSVQGSLSYMQGGDLARFAGCWTQHFEGFDRQHAGYYNYIVTEADVNNYWNSMYSTVMINTDILIKKSEASGSPTYAAVGKILQALALGNVTDAFGDIPYSEAFQGEKKLQPKSDTQQAVYTSIASLLTSAIADLDKASLLSPAADDLIYGGNVAKWKMAASSLMARYANHLSKRDPVGSATATLSVVGSGFKSNGDELVFLFGASETNANPLYAFQSSRGGDLHIGPKLVELLNKTNDPRRAVVGDTIKASDSIFTTTGFGAFFTSPTSPVILCSYAELKFIEAEANLRLGKKSEAKTAYLAGVKASLDFFGVSAADATTYLAQPSVSPAGDVSLESIMEQKYVALYTQPESYVDWRRTGLPTLAPVTGTQIPRRFPTSQNQRLFNPTNLPAGATLLSWMFKPVWWDE